MVDINNFDNRICEKFKISSLQPYQRDVLKALLHGRDVFVSKKTGSGKSMCYQGFSTALNCQTSKCQIFVISPLCAIQEEQCQYLKGVGISAAILGKKDEETPAIMDGDMQYVFASPEQLLGEEKWRSMVRSAAGKGYLRLL